MPDQNPPHPNQPSGSPPAKVNDSSFDLGHTLKSNLVGVIISVVVAPMMLYAVKENYILSVKNEELVNKVEKLDKALVESIKQTEKKVEEFTTLTNKTVTDSVEKVSDQLTHFKAALVDLLIQSGFRPKNVDELFRKYGLNLPNIENRLNRPNEIKREINTQQFAFSNHHSSTVYESSVRAMACMQDAYGAAALNQASVRILYEQAKKQERIRIVIQRQVELEERPAARETRDSIPMEVSYERSLTKIAGSDSPLDYVKVGDAFMNEMQYRHARKLYEFALTLAPGNEEIKKRLKVAASLEEANRPRAISANPDAPSTK